MNFSEFPTGEKRILQAYLVVEMVLFMLIQWSETTRPYRITGKIMYASIVLNAILIFCFYRKYRGDARVPLAIMLTLVADYNLTYLNQNFKIGVTWFILVQAVYAWRTRIDAGSLALRILCVAGYYAILAFLGMDRSEALLCAISMGILTGNVIYAWKNVRKESGHLEDPDFLLALGLSLFAGCDLSLGIRNMMDPAAGRTISIILYTLVYYMTWICYLPSQVLLVLSYLKSLPLTRNRP